MLFIHLKSSFHSQDIDLCSCRKNGVIRKIKLISKFVTSQPDNLVNTQLQYTYHPTSHDQTMKLGQLLEYNQRSIFLQNNAENDAKRLVPDHFLFFKKALCEAKANLVSMLQQPSTWHTIKTSSIKLQTIVPEICSILTFQKRLWEQFLHHILCMTFLEKCFSCHILLIDQISLSDWFYFLRYWAICIVIAYFPDYDVIKKSF